MSDISDDEFEEEKIDFTKEMKNKSKLFGEHFDTVIKDQLDQTKKDVKREAAGFQIDSEAMKEEF